MKTFALSAFLLVLMAGVAGADTLPDPMASGAGLSRIDAARTRCMLDRAQQAASGPSQNLCALTTKEKGFVSHEADRFCKDPASFCQDMFAMQKAEAIGKSVKFPDPATPPHQPSSADPSDRLTQFVSPNCDPAGIQNYDFVSGMDPKYVGLLLKSWGCSATPESGTDVSGIYPDAMKCSADQLPFDCTTGKLKSNIQGQDLSSATDLFKRFVRTKDGDSCVLALKSPCTDKDASDPQTNTGKLPAAQFCKAQNDSNMQSYVGGIADGLYGIGSKRFAEQTKMVFTPENRAMVARKFKAAQDGMLKYLDSIGAPDDVKALVRNTQLANMNPDDPKEMGDLEQQCRTDSMDSALGNFNARNTCNCSFHRAQRSKGNSFVAEHKITICPQALADFVDGNPRGLLQLFGHELGHSIDPCGMGVAQVGNSFPGQDCGATPETPVSDAFKSFASTTGKYAECLHSNSDMGNGKPEVRPATKYKGLAKAMKQQGLCRASDYLDGPTRYCNLSYDRNQVAKIAPQYLGTLDQQREQADEAFADSIGAESLVYAEEADNSGFENYTPEQKQADILTSVAFQCGDWKDVDPSLSQNKPPKTAKDKQLRLQAESDEHPNGPFRESLISSAGSVRQAVCQPPTVAPDADPKLNPAAKCSKFIEAGWDKAQ